MNRLWPYLKDKKLVIFDYNGTILYDTDICVEALNMLLAEQGLAPVTVETYREKFYFPVKNFYADMGFNFSKMRFEDLSVKYHEFYTENLHRCGIYGGIIDLLVDLKHAQIKTAILTALNQKELHRQMPIFGLEGLFDATFGLGDFNAHSKVERGRELIAHMNIPVEDIILVGDTTHDAEVAHDLGIDFVLLDDGHQTSDRLQAKVESSPRSSQGTVVGLNRQFVLK